jgi:hypothetical protein
MYEDSILSGEINNNNSNNLVFNYLNNWILCLLYNNLNIINNINNDKPK